MRVVTAGSVHTGTGVVHSPGAVSIVGGGAPAPEVDVPAEISAGELALARGQLEDAKRHFESVLRVRAGSQRAWIGGMITLPDYQRRGLGTRMMTALMGHARARGIDEFLLDASAEGMPLYTKLGFRPLYDVEVRAAK